MMLDSFLSKYNLKYFSETLLEVTALEEIEYFTSNGIEEYDYSIVDFTPIIENGMSIEDNSKLLEICIYVYYVNEDIDSLDNVIKEFLLTNKVDYPYKIVKNQILRTKLLLDSYDFIGVFVGWYKADKKEPLLYNAMFINEKETHE